MTLPMTLSGIIFILSLYLIFSEKLNRTITSMAGAAVMIGAGLAFNFYSEEQAVEAIDFNTVGLLLGMMILVALLEPTGFFQYLAIWATRWSGGNQMRLLITLGTLTTLLSMFLDNVTTVVLIAPVTILISEILGINATPLLMAEALLSDTGGVSTLVGDPPNVLIASAADFSFNDFLTHSLPVVLVAWLVALALLSYLFRADLAKKPTNIKAILDLNPSEALTDRVTVGKVLIVLCATMILFFMEEILHTSPSFIALAAASVAVVWVQPDMSEMFKRIEWSVLIFFCALFIMVGGLKSSGLLHSLVEALTWGRTVNPAMFGVLLIWVIAILSALVDNVPITIALIPVIQDLELQGINVTPLWWALVFGAGFGGNATIIGSTANIVVATLSEKTHNPITSPLWNKRGLPVMIATCFVASVLYTLAFPLFQ